MHLWVPARAVLDIQGHKSVLTVAANGTVEENPVTIEFSNDQSAVIKTGIADGNLVIADGVNKIRPGTLVAPEVVA